MGLSGIWQVEINTPMGKQAATLQLVEQGGILTGTATQGSETAEITNGVVDGEKASWKVDVKKPFPVKLSFSTIATGDQMTGDVKLGMFGTSKLTGHRV